MHRGADFWNFLARQGSDRLSCWRSPRCVLWSGGRPWDAEECGRRAALNRSLVSLLSRGCHRRNSQFNLRRMQTPRWVFTFRTITCWIYLRRQITPQKLEQKPINQNFFFRIFPVCVVDCCSVILSNSRSLV